MSQLEDNLQRVSNKPLKKILFEDNSGQSGFSLIEILVAFFLMTMVFTLVSNINFTSRQAIDEVLDKLERAIRFGNGEAAIRNTLVRLHFSLDKDPQEWALEGGPNDRFVLPVYKFSSEVVRSLKEEEEFRATVQETNKKFNKLREFSEGAEKLPKGVRIVAMGSSLEKNLVTDFEASLYIYPTGEKDDGIIIVATDEEVVGLMYEAFSPVIERKYITLEKGPDDELGERQLSAAKDLYEEWLKK